MTELFAAGRTKEKISGFTSKAGNIFDARLKYENEQITFDFDAPADKSKQETTNG